MKKIGNKGFTLIELLAVITIMGILMLVAIPAVSRTIDNTRKDTFVTLAKQYISSVSNAVYNDDLKCGNADTTVSATGDGTYYFLINTADAGNGKAYIKKQTEALMEKGGKSPWGDADVNGYVGWTKTGDKITFAIGMMDTAKHVISKTTEKDLKKENIQTNTDISSMGPNPTEYKVECKLKGIQ